MRKNESTASQRLVLWKQALQLIAEKPLFGYGPEGAGVVIYEWELDRPHNEYLQYAVHSGIPGMAAYLTALGSLLLACIRDLRRLPAESLILGAMIFGYCASAFVGNSMYYTTIYFAMGLGLLIGSVTSQKNDERCNDHVVS